MRILLLLALGAFPHLPAQPLRFAMVPEGVVLERLRRIERGGNGPRHDMLRTIFEEAGCKAPELEDEKANGSKLPNLVCTLAGQSGEDIILVTAHFDKVRAGAGAIDNWTGASLLPSLYESMSLEKARKHTFLFVGFSDEEAGLVGSRAWVAAHKNTNLGNIRAMVNIDSVASTAAPLYIWASRADPELARVALSIGKALRIPVEGMNADKVGLSDSAPFRDKKVPVIDFHSLNNQTILLLHTIDDQLSAVNIDGYKSTYRFLAGYLKYLDENLGVKAPAGSASGALN